MKKISSAMIALLMVISAFPAQADVLSKNPQDGHFLRVTKVEQDSVKFELCVVAQPDVCSQVGTRAYTAKEVNKLRKVLYAKSAGLAVADAAVLVLLVKGLAVAGAVVGGVFAEAVLGTSGASTVGAAIWGGLAGAASGLFVSFKVIHPGVPYKKARALRKTVLLDKDVQVKGSITALAENLNSALATLK